ncbi:hypothetical protein [Mycobacterium sp.]|uniref:hypothetical protein n=1 Tax=Mycobacterium sp. TaxID=1785 RepID=UPI003A8B491B
MSADGDELRISLDQLSQLLGIPPPPLIASDELAMGSATVSELLRVLGVAANAGDAADYGEALDGHGEREALTNDALAKFPSNEQQATAQLDGVGGSAEMSQMLQQVPQLASGIAGGIAGALGGILQPLSQIPQQAAQAGQQAMQMGMGMLQSAGAGEAEVLPDELIGGAGEFGDGEFGDGEFGDDGFGGGPGGSGFGVGGAGGGFAGGGGGFEGTTPTALLGPPPTPTPTPSPSPGTFPASSQAAAPVVHPAVEAPPVQRGPMGAMPMVPPGAAHGAGGAGKAAAPDTKRIVGPTVKNGAPVQGRITAPPPAPTPTRHTDGKPMATRRILLPDAVRDGEGRA